jgi:hypothetical protein
MPTIPEIKSELKKLGIKGYSKLNKAELLDLLSKHQNVKSNDNIKEVRKMKEQLLKMDIPKVKEIEYDFSKFDNKKDIDNKQVLFKELKQKKDIRQNPEFQKMVKQSEDLIQKSFTKKQLDDMDKEFLEGWNKIPSSKSITKQKSKKVVKEVMPIEEPVEEIKQLDRIELPQFNNEELKKVEDAINRVRGTPLDRVMLRMIFLKIKDGKKYLEQEYISPQEKQFVKMFNDMRKQFDSRKPSGGRKNRKITPSMYF